MFAEYGQQCALKPSPYLKQTTLQPTVTWVRVSCVFLDYSQTHAGHICLAMTFTVSHLVCCNIRRTVGSLWRSCVISRRVTHLEPSHRADKPLLCLGHLEGRSHLLCCTPHMSQSFRERKRHLTWPRIFHTLTYRIHSGGRASKVALIVMRICYSELRNLEGIQANI